MAPWAGFKLLKIQKNVLSILAIELLIAGASFSLYHSKLKPGKGTSLLLKNIRNIINAKSGDRSLTDEINKLKDIIEDGRIFKTLKSKGFLE
jgi:histidine ammonia-lyase